MFDKLEALLKRYEEIQRLMTDNEVASDVDKCHKLAKELFSLEGDVKKYREYKKVIAEIDEMNKLLKKETNIELIDMAKQEIEQLDERRVSLERELEEIVIEEDEDAGRDVIMEIRAGTGGLEASLFAGDLFRMYSKYAAKKGWKVEVIDKHIAEIGGFKEIIFLLYVCLLKFKV